MDFDKDELRIWNSTKRDENFALVLNFNLESTKTNYGLEYPTKDFTPILVQIDYELFKVESS